jgi:hypothetical protein
VLKRLPIDSYGWSISDKTSSSLKLTVIRQISLSRLMALRAYLEVIFDHDPKMADMPIASLLSPLVTFASWGTSERTFVENLKYCTAVPMARYLRNEPPTCPPGMVGSYLLFSGPVRRYLKARLVSFSRKNSHLFTSILQGVKRGCAQAPKEFVAQSFLKHRRAMSLVPGPVSTLQIGEKCERLLKSLSAVPFRIDLLEASSSASFKRKRSQGGARAEIVNILNDPNDEKLRLLQYRDEQMVLMDPYGKEFRTPDPQRASEAYAELRSKYDTDYRSRLLERSSWVLEPHGDIFDRTEPFDGWASEMFDDPSRDPDSLEEIGKDGRIALCAEVHAVLEPLKVRLITKGEALEYWGVRPMQRRMWGFLKNYPQFCLTSRPVDPSDLCEILWQERRLGLDDVCKGYEHDGFDTWVSGDYSAATDNLNIEVTKTIFEVFLKMTEAPEWYKSVCRSVLYEHELSYPTLSGPPDSFNNIAFEPHEASILHGRGYDEFRVAPVMQSNGQLMGSPLSFPVLCVANLVAYWMALEDYTGKRIKFEDLPVKVNGDDIVFRTNQQFYDLWKDRVNSFGFTLSVGKNYLHKRLVVINSQAYHYVPGRDLFVSIPFFNVGMLTGQSKLTGREKSRVLPLWDWYNTVIQGARDKARAHRRFLHYHKDLIMKMTNNGEYSLFIDRMYGGLGFRLHDDVLPKVYVTCFQRRFSLFLRRQIFSEVTGRFTEKRKQLGIVQENAQPTFSREHTRCTRFTFTKLFGPLPFSLKDPLEHRPLVRHEDLVELARAPNRRAIGTFFRGDAHAQKLRARFERRCQRDDVLYVSRGGLVTDSFVADWRRGGDDIAFGFRSSVSLDWRPAAISEDMTPKLLPSFSREPEYRIVFPKTAVLRNFRAVKSEFRLGTKFPTFCRGDLQQDWLRTVEVFDPKALGIPVQPETQELFDKVPVGPTVIFRTVEDDPLS